MNRFFLILFLFYGTLANATVSLPNFFSDNMVLQRNTKIPIWGWASANESIQINFYNQTKSTIADSLGNWKILLDSVSVFGPFTLEVIGTNKIVISNILVGDVWLCSGQSNMEWTVGQSNNAKIEIQNAANDQIRHVKFEHQISSVPLNNCKTGNWEICSPKTVGNFTAAGYFFAKHIFEKIKVPIGLINSSWGGTNIETWISRSGFESSPEFKEMIQKIPIVNLDSFAKINLQKWSPRIEAIQGNRLNNLKTNEFQLLHFDDFSWPFMKLPNQWESQKIGDLDGIVWFRKTITLTEQDIENEAFLELAMIDDEDITYVNGLKIGETKVWNEPRKYKIPKGILMKGENCIAVKVTDNGGGGGIYGDTSTLQLNFGKYTKSLSGNWKFQIESIKQSVSENSFPSLCYNAMIEPIIPFAIKGALWYQGESNAGRAAQYNLSFPLLIEDWRKKWQNDFPFYFVQLATFYASGNSNDGCSWAELREAQTNTLKVPNTGMVVTTDIGIPNDIHPTNKQDVGKRLAALALNKTYNYSVVASGPSFKSMQIIDNQIEITFENTGSGLMTVDKYGYIKGFEIAGADQKFYFAKAYIKNNKVVIQRDQVPKPIAVNFGWMGDATDCNLFNMEGFPAVPFRTHDWHSITKMEKYKID